MNEPMTWILGFIINLIGVFAIVMQTRVSLERRISVLETYMKILLRDRGISVRATDDLSDEEGYEKRN